MLYLAIWRWHFYAGLFVVPFVLLLAVTGSIYLFKPFVEARLYRGLYEVTIQPSTLSSGAQIESARAAFPEAKPTHYSPPSGPGRSAIVRMQDGALEKSDVFIDPHTGKMIGKQVRDKTLMSRVRKLHGELLLGKFGTPFVELAACWTLVLLITGAFLWWPRKAGFSPWGVLLPRMASGGRVFWRDLHAVGGIYACALILGLLVTGLPWTDVWGDLFKQIQKKTGQAAPPGQFSNPYKSKVLEGANPITVEAVLEIARTKDIPPGMEIEFPKGPTGTYAIHSEAGHHGGASDPANQRMIHIDQYSGSIVKETTWKDFPATAKAVKIGVKLHQGEYFGIPNLLLSLAAALATILLSVTGIVMWWKRKPSGSLGAPPHAQGYGFPKGVILSFAVLAVFLPLVGASMIVVWILEKIAGRLKTARPA